ncbi:MAG: hypothetical protein ACFCU9_00505 [Cyanophyceae cyanobacterium]
MAASQATLQAYGIEGGDWHYSFKNSFRIPAVSPHEQFLRSI